MSTYISNVNRVNTIATVHRDSCVHIIDREPVTNSSEHRTFGDGLGAITWAAKEMPESYTLCGHCMKDIGELITLRRRAA